ncbi:hypothetical protein ACIBO6_13340 [Streptomyces luteogriseus]|uniref:hypothetical protein n=1 Tax=Streptomyces luteogriseus TaxID=68233 RepID=UPI00378E78BB
MGIRTLLSRTAPGMALPPVPAFEAAASTVRVPVTFTSALRHATADLRQRLTTGGRRPTGSADTGVLTAAAALPGAHDPTAAPALDGTDALAALTGLAGTDALSALTGLADTDALAALTGTDALAALAAVIGVDGTPTVSGPTAVTGDVPTESRLPCTPEPPGRPSRPWARLARDYLALVLTLLPRPRPAHTTITVYITTTDSVLSERPGGSAPSRRQGRDRRGPEPDAAP